MYVILFLVLFCLGYCTPDDRNGNCKSNCEAICKNPMLVIQEESALCQEGCTSACFSRDNPYYGNPFFQTSFEFTVPRDQTITDSASPHRPHTSDIFFTTLQGRIYHYNYDGQVLTLLYEFPPGVLDLTNNKGLYGITFNLNYRLDRSRLFYIHYSVPAKNHTVMHQQYETTLAETDLALDHYNVVQEFVIAETSQGLIASPSTILRMIPQFDNERSGGYLQYGLRISKFPIGTSTLTYALGGNGEHSAAKIKHGPYLSMIIQMIPEDQNVADINFASGIRNPIDCTETILIEDSMYCLLRFSPYDVALCRINRNVNYGPQKYVENCNGKLCEARRLPGILDSDPVVVLDSQYCPIRSIFIYSGHNMTLYKTHLFAVSDACYHRPTKTFQPAKLLHLQKDWATGKRRLAEMSTDFQEKYLLDTMIMGDDVQDMWFVSGRSMRTNQTIVQRIIPRIAGELLTTFKV